MAAPPIAQKERIHLYADDAVVFFSLCFFYFFNPLQALEEQKEGRRRYPGSELFVVINESVYSRDINSSVRQEAPTVVEDRFRGTWTS